MRAKISEQWRQMDETGTWWLSDLGEIAKIDGEWRGYPGDTRVRGNHEVPFILAEIGPFKSPRMAKIGVEDWWKTAIKQIVNNKMTLDQFVNGDLASTIQVSPGA